jgi:hypothetical protein
LLEIAGNDGRGKVWTGEVVRVLEMACQNAGLSSHDFLKRMKIG